MQWQDAGLPVALYELLCNLCHQGSVLQPQLQRPGQRLLCLSSMICQDGQEGCMAPDVCVLQLGWMSIPALRSNAAGRIHHQEAECCTAQQ